MRTCSQRLYSSFALAAILATCCPLSSPVVDCQRAPVPEHLLRVKYSSGPILMHMNETRNIDVELTLDLVVVALLKFDSVKITFAAHTLSPQFNILTFENNTGTVEFTRLQLMSSNYLIMTKLRLHASYIGRAIVLPVALDLKSANSSGNWNQLPRNADSVLEVVVVQDEGIWGIIFIASVTLFIIIGYINLGAQLDRESTLEMLRNPKTAITGTLITIVVMPVLSWYLGLWLLANPIYRLGAFIFACGPAASASSLWTVLLDANKELSVGLQVASTVGALITMPILLLIMESNMDLVDKHYSHVVPYGRLVQSLFVLLLALFVGWRYVGSHKRAQEISRKIFRPLTFFVLIYIIVFSSIIYWHIYQMFDWNITLLSILITCATYLIAGILGLLINWDIDQAISVSICATYKNSGIAFAVLMVAFGPPDTYIAFVPCLTQVVTTSLSLYIIYLIVSLVKYIRRRDQPDPIQASKPEEEPAEAPKGDSDGNNNSGGSNNKDSKTNEVREENDDEFIALNVTDVIAEPRKSVNEEQNCPN